MVLVYTQTIYSHVLYSISVLILEVIEPSEATGGRRCFLAEYKHALAACQAYQ